MSRNIFTAAALLAGVALTAMPAQADSVTVFGGLNWTINANTSVLTLVNVVPPGGQVDNIPCIICGTNQPQQFQNFGFNNYQQGGNISTFQAFSDADPVHGGVQLANDTQGTAYTASFLRAAIIGANANFNIGIDVNTANGQTPEVLQRFAVLDVANHVVLAYFSGPATLSTNNNGTGFPDMFLTGFDINRNDILPGAQIEFVAQWSNTSDGAESFFLSPVVAVPGPLAGAGIPGIISALGLLILGLLELVHDLGRARHL
jgi:hypothetical protein